ncbi:MAG: porphobilinogen synthase [Planctomycetota bacterium]|nr:porphobilinogen synthase [Planctomycetota bacterium]MDA1138179.1 porphobilinogen synthase [Planctomycetota bacterium]
MFPAHRPRRLRSNENLRRMVREYSLSVDDFIYPLFVRPGQGERRPIASMPGQFQLSIDEIVKEAEESLSLGVPAILLFGIPADKDAVGSEAYDPNGIVCEAVRAVKEAVPEIVVITDVCLCEYTDHGHCGVVHRKERQGREELVIDNDATLKLLVKESVAHGEAGADMVAPSDMMDGRIGAIRNGLDEAGFHDLPIMAYSAKYASAFYGPFREAAESPPQFGDRSTYQMDPPNSDEAIREVELDIQEGADIVMTKPALAYMDITRRVKDTFNIPIATYNVSGEYAMVKAAAANGWIDEKRVVLEMLTGFRRAGADLILTYWAKDAARWLGGG